MYTHKIKPILQLCGIFLLIIGKSFEVSASNSTFYYYKQLGIQEGLSQSKVHTILNDHRGYLWIGTEFGLNRYDGSSIKQYLQHPKDTTSLPSNDIRFIAEDSLQNLWIATKEGICLYDRNRDCFIRQNIHGKPNLFVASSLLQKDGILFGGEGVIYRFEYATRQWKMLYSVPVSPSHPVFHEMVQYDDSHILINTRWHGVSLFDTKTNTLQKVEKLTEDNYTRFYTDSKGRLWFSPYGKGLYCHKNGKITHHFTTANSALTHNVVLDITEKDNQLWIATDGGGINILSLENYTFSGIDRVLNDINSFPANAIYRIYRDRGNNIWAGSVRHGLIGIKPVYARSYQHVTFENPYGLSEQTVSAFLQDDKGILWIGTDGGGINRFDPVTGLFRHYFATKYDKVTSITGFTSQELLFFVFNKGFFLLNKETGQIRSFNQADKALQEKVYCPGVRINLQQISPSKLLISAKHTYIYDLITRQVEEIGQSHPQYAPLIIGNDESNAYLLGANSVIYQYSLTNGSFDAIYRGQARLKDACIDKKGIFWLASTEGLIRYNPANQETLSLQTPLFNEATSVIADSQSRIWIGTHKKTFIYHIPTGKFMTLDESDGVSSNEFLPQSHLLLNNGDIVIGGINGMNYFKSDILFGTEAEYRIDLQNILLNGQSITWEDNDERKRIQIPYDFSSLQIEFFPDSKNLFRQDFFQFNIDGLDNKYSYAGNKSLTINHLPIGEYTVSGTYYTRNGEWSRAQEILHITVSPPWWRTSIFYACTGLFIGLVFWRILYKIDRRKRIKQKQEVARMKNKMYEEKINFLTNISHELRTPLTLICAPLKRIINNEVEEDEELYPQLTSVYKQARHMKSIIDMVLELRKLEEGKEMLHILPHPLNEWIHSVGDMFITEFEMKGIHLTYELDEKVQDISFDRNKCEFVISNFLMNALKFSDADTTVTITSQLSQEEDWVRVSVKDQGIGLQMVDIDSLFTNFYQGNHDKGGSGIGLSYAKNLITYHNGKIGAINNQELGATFYFELPTRIGNKTAPATAQATDMEETEQLPAPDYTFLKGFSVIVVEDATDLRNYLKESLQNYFAKVYVAKDGKEGIELIKHCLPDIIISDVMMPRMNGFELCHTVKTNLQISHIPFVLLTAHHNSQNMYTGYKTGADVFLPKPFEIDGLLALTYNQLKLWESIRTRYKNDNNVSLQEISFSNADETFLIGLNEIIQKSMDDPEMNVDFLASRMCISRSLLFNKIKTLTGMGIVEYVSKQRIEKAAILLTTTSMNVTEISELVGFSTLKYFTKIFKNIKGVPPSLYKKGRMD